MRVLLHYAWLHVAQRLADEMRACYATWDPSNETKSRLTNPQMQNTAMRACEASGTSDDGSDGGGDDSGDDGDCGGGNIGGGGRRSDLQSTFGGRRWLPRRNDDESHVRHCALALPVASLLRSP